jgi:hypothetical protein
MRKDRLLKWVVFIVLLLAVMGAGFYWGATYGLDIFKSEARRQAEIATIEKDLVTGLSEGRTANVVGRIRSVDPETGTISFLDQTLGAVYKAPGGVVARIIQFDKQTLIVREEVAGGPHFLIRADQLKAGQLVAIYLAAADFKTDKAVAKEIIVPVYAPLDPDLAGQAFAGQ